MVSHISALDEFKAGIAAIWANIEDSCRTCSDPDCMGYVWLTDSDADKLMRAGHGVVRVNPPGGPRFLDSYIRDSLGRVSVQVQSPTCPYLSGDRRCSIHDLRPLVCHLYPLSLETFPDGSIYWALHQNCNHVRAVTRNGGLEELVREISLFLENIPAPVRDDILSAHRAASSVSQPVSERDASCLRLIARVQTAESST